MARFEFLTKEENFILDWTGVILMLVGVAGGVLTFFFDFIARQDPIWNYGWLQVLGIFCFIGLFVFGLFVDGYMKEVKEILKDYVKK